ncbi:MAG: Hsp70 family protein [Pseudonocardia sp.]|uniref:Hsp70 family protein n=1 Tax=Pseudonocardia sp. TaxID=60912 RepID=UPI001AC38E61|nr:Hsp70 family protein [Pseudonocardia sp.]MBN9102142.1 Hsp70 family protein [Pseudonocardia sp.]
MSYLLGIDVGTTRTAAAISRAGGRPGDIEVVNLGDRSSAVPSVLFLGSDGAVVVGDAAERRAATDPDHVVREFKRRIGDPTPVLVGGRPWAPEELSALLVRWVADRVAQREGGGAARIAVTHPASWGAHKKDLLRAALNHHGLPVTFLAEPQAAAMHYAAAERIEPGSTVAVYDFGGGTFDAAVVHKDTPRSAGGAGIDTAGFGLMGRPEGVERLGGIDLDELVFEHVREGLPEAFEGLDETDPAVLSAVASVRRECTEAKEALSSDTEVSIPVLTPAGQGSVRLHRSEFEAMIRPQVEETVSALRRAVGSAGLTPEQLTAVLLVGGSSRIPLVAQLVSDQLGRPVAVDTDPKNAIAMGAALSLIPPSPAGTGPFVPAPRVAGATQQPFAAAVPPAAFTQSGPAVAPPRPLPAATGSFAGAPADFTPPTQRISTTGSVPPRMVVPPPPPPPPPPPRPSLQDQFAADHDYVVPDRYPSRRGLSPALLVSVGGAAAAVAIVAAAFLVPRQTTTTVPLGQPVQSQSTASMAPPAPTTDAAPTEAPPVTTVPEVRPSNPPRTQVPPVLPPVVTTTTTPPKTTTPAPTTTTKPTTAPTTDPPAPPTTPKPAPKPA